MRARIRGQRRAAGTFFALLSLFFAPPAFAAPDADPVARSDLALFLHLGVGRHDSELRVLRGATYGLDLRYRFAQHATLEAGCEQYQSADGTAELQLRSWRTTCGVTLGGGYRSRVFFVGAAGGVDALISTHVLSYGTASSRTWTLRPVARLEASVLYVSKRYRLGLRARVRLASEYVDARFVFSIGYAFRSF
ncbi:MAG: hypothetical protein AB8H86_01670 [Polyangiales bacterium]